MMLEYTKEELIDLVAEYTEIDLEEEIDFSYIDNAYVLEFTCHPLEMGSEAVYNCVATLTEEFNEEEEELKKILIISVNGYHNFVDDIYFENSQERKIYI